MNNLHHKYVNEGPAIDVPKRDPAIDLADSISTTLHESHLLVHIEVVKRLKENLLVRVDCETNNIREDLSAGQKLLEVISSEINKI